MQSRSARNVVEGLTQTSESYNHAIRCLQKCYDQPCVLHCILGACSKDPGSIPLKIGNGQELHRLLDHLQQHIRMLKVLGEYDIETYLTAAIELKLDEGTKLRWTEHSSKCETTTLCEDLLEFLHVQARHHKSVAHSAQSVPKATPRTAGAAEGVVNWGSRLQV